MKCKKKQSQTIPKINECVYGGSMEPRALWTVNAITNNGYAWPLLRFAHSICDLFYFSFYLFQPSSAVKVLRSQISDFVYAKLTAPFQIENRTQNTWEHHSSDSIFYPITIFTPFLWISHICHFFQFFCERYTQLWWKAPRSYQRNKQNSHP